MGSLRSLILILRRTGIKLSLLLVLFAYMILAGLYDHTKTVLILAVVMVAVGANGEGPGPAVPKQVPIVDETPEPEPESKEPEFVPEEERDQLVGNHSTFNPAFKYYRAGNCECPTCGLLYWDHPVIRMPEKRFYGCELFVLCNTDRVKL